MVKAFWCEAMFGYDWNHRISLSMDCQYNLNHQPINHSYTASSKLNIHLTAAAINFAATKNISLESLFLTCYYIFIHKVSTDNDTDICVLVKSKHICSSLVNL